MSCEPAIYIHAGTTWAEVFEYRDEDGALVSLAGLNARGVLRNSANSVVLTLTSAGGSPNLVVDPAGTITTAVASDVTPSLVAGGARTDLTLYLEVYDGSSPPVVTNLIDGQCVIVKPDEIP
jgi:hypothetical protein